MKNALIFATLLSLTCANKTYSFDINQHGPFVYLAAFLSYGFYHFCIKDQNIRLQKEQKQKELASVRNIEAGIRFTKMQEQKNSFRLC